MIFEDSKNSKILSLFSLSTIEERSFYRLRLGILNFLIILILVETLLVDFFE